MATIVLGAAGMALGGAIGGSVLGLSAAAVGQAAGAALGRVIDQHLFGAGSEPVETGRLDRLRLTGAGEGAPVARIFGRMRVPGQVIWASDFIETSSSSGGGKGRAPRPRVTEYSYSVSLAIALCEGEIARVGRIWADGAEIAPDSLSLRVYKGGQDQQPDPKMEAAEGAGNVPAYRGTAYVVIEDLDLGPYGGRVPQFTFEVLRPAQDWAAEGGTPGDLAQAVRGVALLPGTGEYALATQPVRIREGFGRTRVVNVNSASGRADFPTSLDALEDELPHCGSVSLIVSWFGGDLRAGSCRLRPKVEQNQHDSYDMPWRVSGLGRAGAEQVARVEDRSVYGGTPADASVMQAIREIAARGREVLFSPFILMDQAPGNILPDPWSGNAGQPHLPWRGRITTSLAPGLAGSPDGTAQAEAEVAAFFGRAAAGDFTPQGDTVLYHGPEEWSYRRFILHYAHLCAQAGGVGAFSLGSEMRALTQIRGAGGGFPAVAALRALAAEVRQILGPECRIGYAADWSEYHGYQPAGTRDKLFHLDPLWADDNIDFIGIDNYMPLSDWRDGAQHADAYWGSVYNLDYLKANVAGGEGYDWYYPTPRARAAQQRVIIQDSWDEPWVWRVKDLKGWWQNRHHDRVDGLRSETPTPWIPQSKPIWFTEFGCAAIDRGTNQPNRFLDPKSSESALPHFSKGIRDEYIQVQYLRAVASHFADPENNPVSHSHGHRMVDMSRAHVWAWDARPWPAFPARDDLWSDGDNYALGHWINGRTAGWPLESVVREICAGAGMDAPDTARLHGLVRGYGINEVGTMRAALQPLMLAYGFDAVERDGKLAFRSRAGRPVAEISAEKVVQAEGDTPAIERVRAPAAESAGRVRLGFVEADGNYETGLIEAAAPDEAAATVTQSELPLALTRAEARAMAGRWLNEARVARDRVHFALPPSRADLGTGDVIWLKEKGGGGTYRIDRVEQTESRLIEAVRIEPATYLPQESAEEPARGHIVPPPAPVEALFLDLPLLRGDESPHAPHLALNAAPWPGQVALYSSASDSDYGLDRSFVQPAVMGLTRSPLAAAAPGIIDRGPALEVELIRGALQSVTPEALLAGANLAAIGDGTPDNWEVFQFQQADLLGPDRWALRLRLRGQVGSDGLMPALWPEGSYFVLLDGGPRQIGLPAAAQGVLRHYRFGPAARPLDDPAFQHASHAFAGNGLRPYPVCHLRARQGSDGLAVNWIRRSRIHGDSWEGVEVPLGEEAERYRLLVLSQGREIRETVTETPSWVYGRAEQAGDGLAPGQEIRITVAQLSSRFGAGPAREVAITL